MNHVLNSNELQALKNYCYNRSALNRLREVLCRFGGRNIRITENHLLLGRTKPHNFMPNNPALNEEENGYRQNWQIYFGFRYWTNFYYNHPLLEGGCDVVVYVKDAVRSDEEAAVLNNIIAGVYRRLVDFAETTGATFDHYPNREHNNECRLAIRKSILDFKGDLDAVHQWLEEALNTLISKLP